MTNHPTNERFTAGVTVGDLRRQLEIFPDDAELYMGGLRFYRLKSRGPQLVQLEFNEVVYRDADGALVAEDIEPPPAPRSALTTTRATATGWLTRTRKRAPRA